VGGSWVWGQPWLPSESLPQNPNLFLPLFLLFLFNSVSGRWFYLLTSELVFFCLSLSKCSVHLTSSSSLPWPTQCNVIILFKKRILMVAFILVLDHVLFVSFFFSIVRLNWQVSLFAFLCFIHSSSARLHLSRHWTLKVGTVLNYISYSKSSMKMCWFKKEIGLMLLSFDSFFFLLFFF
jgi:hypothetical protein